jgi:hypothetical protein
MCARDCVARSSAYLAVTVPPDTEGWPPNKATFQAVKNMLIVQISARPRSSLTMPHARSATRRFRLPAGLCVPLLSCSHLTGRATPTLIVTTIYNKFSIIYQKSRIHAHIARYLLHKRRRQTGRCRFITHPQPIHRPSLESSPIPARSTAILAPCKRRIFNR